MSDFPLPAHGKKEEKTSKMQGFVAERGAQPFAFSVIHPEKGAFNF